MTPALIGIAIGLGVCLATALLAWLVVIYLDH